MISLGGRVRGFPRIVHFYIFDPIVDRFPSITRSYGRLVTIYYIVGHFFLSVKIRDLVTRKLDVRSMLIVRKALRTAIILTSIIYLLHLSIYMIIL